MKERRGICTICRRALRLRGDGLLPLHYKVRDLKRIPARLVECEGGRRRPLEVLGKERAL